MFEMLDAARRAHLFEIWADAQRELCHWRQNRAGCQDAESHWSFHYGSPCPYDVTAAWLLGEPDPRDAVSEWRIDLPFKDGKPPITLNGSHGNQFAHNAKVKYVKSITRNAVRDAGVPHLDMVHVEIHWRPPTNARRDPDNVVATLKPCIDALHQPEDRWSPIVDGDEPRYVSWSRPTIHPANKTLGPATWLILRAP